MVRFSFDYGAGTIELLRKDKAYHLVRERHLRQRDFPVGTLVYIR